MDFNNVTRVIDLKMGAMIQHNANLGTNKELGHYPVVVAEDMFQSIISAAQQKVNIQ